MARFALLASLYFSQGLPYGFFTQALPVWMRQQGLSPSMIGASSLLALPWALKFLWAPLVDRHSHSPFGRRRGWILPLQAATVLCLFFLAMLGSFISGGTGVVDDTTNRLLWMMAVAMFVTNLFAATQDIATDGLAVDILRAPERGVGNGIQVAAYRVGMIFGGGAVLAGFAIFGWTVAMVAMAALVAVMSVPILLYRDRVVPVPTRRVDLSSSSSPSAASSAGAPAGASRPTRLDDVDEAPVTMAAALSFLRRGGGTMAVWCVGLAAFKLGDAIGSPMARVMLVDLGYSVTDIAAILGTGGSVAGMVGAMLGGLAARHHRLRALVVTGLIHAALMAAYALPAASTLPVSVCTAILILEHLTGGMATVALFTAMMDAADPRTGATDYTVQASVVVLASGVGSALSGVSADAMGYPAHFLMSGAVCVAGALVMIPLYRRGIAPRSITHPEAPSDSPQANAGRPEARQ